MFLGKWLQSGVMPEVTESIAGSIVLLIAVLAHAIIKVWNGVAAAWMAKQASRREVWTPEQRASMRGGSAVD